MQIRYIFKRSPDVETSENVIRGSKTQLIDKALTGVYGLASRRDFGVVILRNPKSETLINCNSHCNLDRPKALSIEHVLGMRTLYADITPRHGNQNESIISCRRYVIVVIWDVIVLYY